METPIVAPPAIDNSHIALYIGAFILANGTTIGLIVKWAVGRAVDYTHLVRDVRELQQNKKDQDAKNDKVQTDLKGLSIKIDRKTNNKGEPQ